MVERTLDVLADAAVACDNHGLHRLAYVFGRLYQHAGARL
jgi:hypothetical protein